MKFISLRLLFLLLGTFTLSSAANSIGICRSTGGAASAKGLQCTNEIYDYSANPNCTCQQIEAVRGGKTKCSLKYDPGPGFQPIFLYGCQ